MLVQKNLIKCDSPSKFKREKKGNEEFRIRKKFIVSDDSSEAFSGKEN